MTLQDWKEAATRAREKDDPQWDAIADAIDAAVERDEAALDAELRRVYGAKAEPK